MIENFNEALEILKNHKKIIVTGPQRAGTTIAAKTLAKRLNLEFIDEEEIRVSNKKLFDQIINERNNFTLQCPGMPCNIHSIGNREDVFVIFMIRDVYDILLSQYRINWNYDQLESKKYINAGFDVNINIPSSIIKYHIWNQYQKDKIKNKMELWYECLKTDDMWVDKKDRINFSPKQTFVGQKRPPARTRAQRKNKSGFKTL